jgi:hypothetical protein
MNTDKKYHKEVAVFIVLLAAIVFIVMFTANLQSKSFKKYCEDNPSQCQPAIYPGKVIEND